MNSLTGFVYPVVGIAQDSFVSKAVLLNIYIYIYIYIYVLFYFSIKSVFHFLINVVWGIEIVELKVEKLC